jgi:hypothetical protein
MVAGMPVLDIADEKNNADIFFGVVGQYHGVRYVFAIEENVGFLHDRVVVEWIAHMISPPPGLIQRASSRRRV